MENDEWTTEIPEWYEIVRQSPEIIEQDDQFAEECANFMVENNFNESLLLGQGFTGIEAGATTE